MSISQRSFRGLDWVNLLMADVKDGVGVYLSVYLLLVRDWNAAEIGLAIALPGLIGIIVQTPVGAFIDSTRHKRLMIVIASFIIGLGCLSVILSDHPFWVYASQLLNGLVQSVYAPCMAAITLGMVGHELLARRIGRNESFNHLGNMLAAVVAGLIGYFYRYEGIFYFSILQCLAIIAATFVIREKDIDHDMARAALKINKRVSVSSMKELIKDKKILLFTISMCMLHFSNGAMLPLLGQKIGIKEVENSILYLSVCIIIAQSVMVFVAPKAARWAESRRKNIFMLAFMILPLRALLFAFIDDAYILTSLQVLDGLAAGIFGVVSILMMADLSKDTGHFNFLQGAVYSAMGLGGALSNSLAGLIVKHYGYYYGFLSLAFIGLCACIFFWVFVDETSDVKNKASKIFNKPSLQLQGKEGKRLR